eukprot:209248-Chlamydomonas_euryale.AAC.1
MGGGWAAAFVFPPHGSPFAPFLMHVHIPCLCRAALSTTPTSHSSSAEDVASSRLSPNLSLSSIESPRSRRSQISSLPATAPI